MPYLELAVAIAAGVFFYKAAEQEKRSPVMWVALSVLVSAALIFKLNASALWVALAQVALLPLIALWRMWRENDSGEARSK